MVDSQIYLPSQHPTEDELVAHAAGQLDLTHRVLLDAHLAYCSRCREIWASLTSAGAQVLAEAPEEAPPEHLLDSLLSKIQAEKQAPDPYARLPLPKDVLASLPRPLQPLAWGSPERWTKESKVACVWTEPQAQAQLFLLEVPGGDRIPRHEHLGHEHVLCLAGACTDEHTHLEAGDFYSYPPDTEHYPVMDGDDPCWLAVRIEKGVRYSD